jgi:large subunit ribosomal protein L24
MDAGPHGPTQELALQTTLLSLAIAIILALVAALVGPLLIDWSGYRTVFEAEAGHLIGVDVRVTGAIDARLLPSPRLTLHDIEIGRGDDKIGAQSLGIEFALGPLMRGQWHAAELHLAGAQLRLGIDAKGRMQAPNIPINFSPDALSIDRLSIEDSAVTVGDSAHGAGIKLDKLWFNGEARSLVGPFSGEGATTIGGELYPFRISTGRVGDDGVLKLHLNVDPVNYPLSIETDGALAFVATGPSFEGTLNLARPVGIAAGGAALVTQPWRVSGKLKATLASALMQQFDFQYGSDSQAIKLTGTAEFAFGSKPRFDGVLSGRQIDLDRALATGDGGRPAPAVAIRRLADLAASAFRPTFPIQIGVGIDRVTLGGDAVDALRGDISTDAGGWNLDRFEFRAPGFTQVRLSGRLAVDASGVAFTGPADIDATDPNTFAAWVEGRAPPEKSEMKPLRLRGDVTLSSEKLGIERLNAQLDRKAVTGRLIYAFATGNRGARLEAVLTAPELDVDAALGFGKALLAGSNLQRPQDMVISADIGHASFAGVEARDASARLKVDDSGLHIDRLSVADLGGGALSASGRIEMGGHGPRGALTLDFETRQTSAIAALAGKFAAASAAPVAGTLERVAHAKLHATLDMADGKDNAAITVAQLSVAGDLDAMRIDAKAQASSDWAKPATADVHIDATIDAAEGASLIKLIGLDRIAAAGKGPGQFKLQIGGRADGMMSGSLRFAGNGLSVTSPLAVTGLKASLEDIDATIAGSAVRGRLGLAFGSPLRIDGALDLDAASAENLISGAIGMPSPPAANNGGWIWPSAPFAGGILGDLAGEVTLKAQRINLTPKLAAREFRATMRLSKDSLALDDMAAVLAGGRLSGQLKFQSNGLGLNARGKMALAGADAAGLLPASARPPITGMIDISAELEGAGLSPAALVGSLRGAGHVTLSDGQLAGLDPHSFDIVSRAADTGMAPGVSQLSAMVGRALDGGRFAVKHAQGDFTVGAGQARLGDLIIHGGEAELSIVGNADLTDGALDARLVLSGRAETGGPRPDIYIALNGPLATPARSVDVSALTGWLTLRAIEAQARKIKAIESAAPRATPAAPVAPMSAPEPKTQQAPAMPAPVVISPLPAPPSAARPEASVDPHH